MARRGLVYRLILMLTIPVLAYSAPQSQREAGITATKAVPIERLNLEKPITIILPSIGLDSSDTSGGSVFADDLRQLIVSGTKEDYISDNLLVLFPKSYSALDFPVQNSLDIHFIAAPNGESLYFLPRSLLYEETNRIYEIDLATGGTKNLRLNKPAFLSLYRGVPHAWYDYGYTVQALTSPEAMPARHDIPWLTEKLDWGASPFLQFHQLQVAGDFLYLIEETYGKSPLEVSIIKLPIFDYSAPIVEYQYSNPAVVMKQAYRPPLRDVYSDGDTVIWSDKDSNFYVLNEVEKDIRLYQLRIKSTLSTEQFKPTMWFRGGYYHHETGRLLIQSPENAIFFSEDGSIGHPVSLIYDIDLAKAKLVRLVVLVDSLPSTCLRYSLQKKALVGIDVRFAIRLEDQTDLGQVQTWNWTW